MSYHQVRSLTFLKPQGRPPYSPKVIRYSLLLWYSSRQAYSLLLNEIPLPSFSLLEKLSRGSLDALKVAKIFLEEERISKDCTIWNNIPLVIRTKATTKLFTKALSIYLITCYNNN